MSTDQFVMITIDGPHDSGQTDSAESSIPKKYQRNGFDPQKNWGKKIGNCMFSIPSYYRQVSESNGSDSILWIGADDTRSPVLVGFHYADLGDMEGIYEHIDEIIDNSFSTFGDAYIDKDSVEILQLQGNEALLIRSDVYPDEGPALDIYLVMYFVSPNRVYRVLLIQEADARFDYSNDFIKMIESVEIDESITEPIDDGIIAKGIVGDSYIEVIEWKIITGRSGESYIVLIFNWTNNSEETTYAGSALSIKAFQGGVGLDYGFPLDFSVDYGSLSRDIRPGTTIPVNWIFTLYDTETDVEFEISDLWDWYGKSKTLAFTIHLK